MPPKAWLGRRWKDPAAAPALLLQSATGRLHAGYRAHPWVAGAEGTCSPAGWSAPAAHRWSDGHVRGCRLLGCSEDCHIEISKQVFRTSSKDYCFARLKTLKGAQCSLLSRIIHILCSLPLPRTNQLRCRPAALSDHMTWTDGTTLQDPEALSLQIITAIQQRDVSLAYELEAVSNEGPWSI